VKELILGGARSGKSRLAQERARESGRQVVVVATAVAGDDEMAARIAAHRAERPPQWRVVEEPVALASALVREAAADRCLLVDCLTLWLGNLLTDDALGPSAFERERAVFLEALPALPGRVLLVSNEVGLGIVPVNALARRFRDEAGRLNQDLACLCDRVVLTVAGLPQILKDAKS
jgi:adenosylcobinamide kinase/adenosylcobinamide-phosphate guanylyltransferase